MLVADILKDKGEGVFSLAPEASLGEACRMLAARRVGALMICRDGEVLGVLSERDVVRVLADRGDGALDEPAEAHMTREVIYAAPGDTTAEVMRKMTERRVRHLPVRRDGRLVGVISIGDVVARQINEARAEAESLKAYISAG